MPFLTHKPCAVAAVAALCVLTTVTGCSSGGSKTSSATASASGSGKSAHITIKDFAFKPAHLTVAAGTKITVTNNDSAAHTVTAKDKKSFDTDTIAPGQTVTFNAPAKAGTYPYYCSIHPYMKGTLTLR
ncbi:cupredoxin domain-containing protein [Streptomyces sp. NPDC051322]|uniref:cupredoxin domain-containing protein n=1 Tax=Streptomyces sp. NPDC051322 TaxID=3154645 RepID=UPI00344EE14E